MRTPISTFMTFAAAALMAAACTGATTTPSPAVTTGPTATAAPTSTPGPTPAATPTSIPMTDGVGPEYVIGTSNLLVTKEGTQTIFGDVTQLRGQEMTGSGTMNDPRLTGGTTRTVLNADIYSNVASEWGTTRVENAGGAWEGTWTGASWNAATATAVSGWLVGSGGYAGWTFYFHVYGTSEPFLMEGIIFKGSPPTP